MNWDEQLIAACTETDGTPHPHTDHVLTGAKWQRDQLRTNEAIERVARAMAGLEPGEEWPSNEALGGSLTGTRDDEYRDGMREQAKEAITALLGEEPCPR